LCRANSSRRSRFDTAEAGLHAFIASTLARKAAAAELELLVDMVARTGQERWVCKSERKMRGRAALELGTTKLATDDDVISYCYFFSLATTTRE
jgi:hypothetical protein